MSDNIKVVVKVRPLIPREIEEKLSYQWRVKDNTLFQIDSNGRDTGQSYTFDKVYSKETKTTDVYNDIAKPIIEAAIAGFNGTIFAYGQTSSGKTYTMSGSEDSPGIIQLAVHNLFHLIKSIPNRDFLVRVSYVEIYNETLIDLLNIEKDNVKIRESAQGGVKVDAEEKMTTSPEEVLDVMKLGKANRQTGSTNMNEESSRSHSIFQITIESREHVEGEENVGCVNVSQLNLVDLAGSERAGQTGTTGIRFIEGTHINKSLSTLALVIKQLSEGHNKYVNYRDSKLTRILQNSLGGNAKTSIICAVTPAAIEETISTLQFANRAKAIKNTPAVNAVTTNATMIQNLTKQLCTLKTQLEGKKTVEQDNYNLQKQIAALQRLILNGFGQRSSADMISGARRKLHQPRRITISTLHPIQEDSVPAPIIPKFCTPVLKYNPMSISSEFLPVQNAPSLSSLPEEPPRLVTPPPKERKVNFSEDVIEIDSDDEPPSDTVTCSPYHKCYESSKTPPCILRKNAKQAEKNLKDIVELTEREKIYAPNVTELMEKLDKNAKIISRLEDEVHTLTESSIEKDKTIVNLKASIRKAEEQSKNMSEAKMGLETLCEEYKTKLTEWDVSYDILKKKSKSREDELLSLLEEQSIKKSVHIGLPAKTIDKELTNFMEMSRDISLVNSDNENSILNPDDNTQKTVQDSIVDLQAQLIMKEQSIIELEAAIDAHQQKILSVEMINTELTSMVDTYKEKAELLENENSVHKANIDNLNIIIDNQKTNLESIKADIDSYNSTIQELQIKLIAKENVPKLLISDSEIENMIANEQMFLANNENMKNIIQSLKVALLSRNEDIGKLKSELENQKTSFDDKMKKFVINKEGEISLLTEEISHIKLEMEEKITTIHELLTQKTNLVDVEQQLTNKICKLEDDKSTLNNRIEKYLSDIEILKEENENFKVSLYELDANKIELSELNNDMTLKIVSMSQIIENLRMDIREKEEVIASLTEQNNGVQEHLAKAKHGVSKILNIVSILTGDIEEVPEIVDSFVTVFQTLSNKLTALEQIAIDIVAQKEDISTFVTEQEAQLKEFIFHVEKINKEINLITNEGHFSSKDDTLLENQEAHPFENQLYKSDLNARKSAVEKLYDDLRKHIQNLHINVQTKISVLTENVQYKEMELANLKQNLNEIENAIVITSEEQKHQNENKDDIINQKEIVIQNILVKATELITDVNIENNLSLDINNAYEQIMVILEKVKNDFTLINLEQAKHKENESNIMCETKKEIHELSEQNMKLIIDLDQIENSNADLLCELETCRHQNGKLIQDLESAKKILDLLKAEVKAKSNEMEILESKATEWRDQFINLEFLMKEQLHLMHLENTELKVRMSELIRSNETENFICNGESNDYFETSRDAMPEREVISPPSLLTICCNKIINVIQPTESEKSITISSTNSNTCSTASENKAECQCNQLILDLKKSHEDNLKLKEMLEHSKSINIDLYSEKVEVEREVTSLLELTKELNKKVINHRTNLSTLTATTYAENTLLSSQVKFLQHHHNRFHTVCQKDIPAFKKQLQDLLLLLRSENAGKHNESFKRFSLPNALDSTCVISNFKNESTFDGDLLMLDTNVTLTTSGDVTLMGHDQTCYDVTQVCLSSDVACQTSECSVITDCNLLQPQSEKVKFFKALESLKIENHKLRLMVDEYSQSKETVVQKSDAQNSPVKFHSADEYLSQHVNDDGYNSPNKTSNESDIEGIREKYTKEIELLNEKLLDLETRKNELEEKCNNLTLEMPSTEILVGKLSSLEKEYNDKQREIENLKTTLSNKNKQITDLQNENDDLSTQVMESISEADDLKKEHDSLKALNSKLNENYSKLEKLFEVLEHENKSKIACSECIIKDEQINELQSQLKSSPHRFNRSYSASDSSSRYNKICTLQNELHAGREDCNELKQEVTTIKNHLERSNLSIAQAMDLDESMGDTNIFSFAKDVDTDPQMNTDKPSIAEERLDPYSVDKNDCFNYYVDKTGLQKDVMSCDIKIVDIMNMLYDYMTTNHKNENENLVNKLKDFEESKVLQQKIIDNMKNEHSIVTRELQEKNSYLQTVADVVAQLRNVASNETTNESDVVTNFKDNFLRIIDSEFGCSSVSRFNYILNILNNKYHNDFIEKTDQCKTLEKQIENMSTQLKEVFENVTQMNTQLTNKEGELDRLKIQKERLQEISNAVTLDIVKKEQEVKKAINDGYNQLVDHSLITSIDDYDPTTPPSKNLIIIFEQILKQCKNNQHTEIQQEIDIYNLQIQNLKKQLEEKNKTLQTLHNDVEKLQEINNNLNMSLIENNDKLQNQLLLHKDLNNVYQKKSQENETNLKLIEKLTDETKTLKEVLDNKEVTVKQLQKDIGTYKQKNTSEIDSKITELLADIEKSNREIESLKSINQLILTEKEACKLELEKSSDIIHQNRKDVDKLSSDILVLKESIKENVEMIENLKSQTKSLIGENMQLKSRAEEKCQGCIRLEMNIKTHEKTAEIQSRMIMRLQKQKEEDNKVIQEKEKRLEELVLKCTNLQQYCEELTNSIKVAKDEIDVLNNGKQTLQSRISELESQLSSKPRLSTEVMDTSRRRRQSIHDSKRMFGESVSNDPNKQEPVSNPRERGDDVFMDVDDDSSNRSTPVRLSKGRDSALSRHDQSDRSESLSREDSAQRSRQRRQSTHDLQRAAVTYASEHSDPTNRQSMERKNLSSSSQNNDSANEMILVRQRLAACQEELEELRERYRELDEECETCAEYLRERDEQCLRLKKDKMALEHAITELKKLQESNSTTCDSSKVAVSHAAVNTDEDWANLHSVVVDRMSYNAEVEKNKKLNKIIEELRFKKQDLKTTLAKMQKALEKSVTKHNNEIEELKEELESCRQELESVKERCRELDEECETCAEYLRERDDQCRKLKEAKMILEAKLLEYEEDATLKQSARKKRQSIHDQNRHPAADVTDASTETSEGFLSYQVERDENSHRKIDDTHLQELKKLKMALERVSQQKASLEQQLGGQPAPAPLLVATGSAIVQNQQLTDVMKENQKLKKVNAKLITICKKRGKSLCDSNRENQDPDLI